MTGTAAILTSLGLGNLDLSLDLESKNARPASKDSRPANKPSLQTYSELQSPLTDHPESKPLWPWNRPAPEAPFRLYVPKADIRLSLVPKSFETANLSWYAPDTRVNVQKDGKINSHLEIRDNRLLSIFRSLLNFHGISFENLFFLGELDQLMGGSLGGVHAIIKTSPESYEDYTDGFVKTRALGAVELLIGKFPIDFQFISPFTKALPLGTDYPYVSDVNTPTELEYPSQENPKLDFNLTRLIPSSLTDEQGFLFNEPELNDLIQRIYQFVDQQKNKGLIKQALAILSESKFSGLNILARWALNELKQYKPEAKWKKFIKLGESGAHPQELLDLFQKGELEVDVGELADFFWPGVLELGKSTGVLGVGFEEPYKEGEKIGYAAAKGLDLQLKSLTSLPFIKDLRIQDGEDYIYEKNQEKAKGIAGGIHASFDPKTKTLSSSASLKVSVQLELPRLGETEVNFNLVYKIQIQGKKSNSKEEGKVAWTLVPQENLLYIQDLSIKPGNEELDLKPKLNLEIHDRDPEFSGFQVSMAGNLGDAKETQVNWQAQLPIPQQDGFYHWENFHLQNDLDLSNGVGEELELDATLSSPQLIAHLASKNFSWNDLSWLGARLVIDQVRYEDGSPKKQQDFSLQNGLLVALQKKNTHGDTTWELATRAEKLQWGTEALQALAGKLAIRQHPREDGKIEYSARLGLEAKSQKLKGSKLQGPIRVALEPCEEEKDCRFPKEEAPHWELAPLVEQGLQVLWDPKTQVLSVEGLNDVYQVSGIPLSPKLKAQQRVARRERRLDGERLGPRVLSTMAQGAIKGYYTFDFNKFKGHGNLGLDENYGSFLDRRGNPTKHQPYKNTHLVCSKFDRFIFEKGYALGKCEIKTTFDGTALAPFDIYLNLEAQADLDYQQFPYQIRKGLESITSDYYHDLFQSIVLNPEIPEPLTLEEGRS